MRGGGRKEADGVRRVPVWRAVPSGDKFLNSSKTLAKL